MTDQAPVAALAGTVAVVYNPIKRGVDQVREAVIASAATRGWPAPLFFETTELDAGEAQAREAVVAGASLVIAAGGDGTVRSVAGALRGTDVPLAILPQGTGNLMARTLGVPLNDVSRAVELAFEGEDRLIDVGVALFADEPDGDPVEHTFLVIAGIGIDAAMISNTSPSLKARLGWLAYVDGALRSVRDAQPTRVRYRVDDHSVHERNAYTVLVGNVGALPGNLELMPGAEIDDGLLDIAVMHPRTRFGWLLVWRSVLWENHVLRRSRFNNKLTTFRTKRSRQVLTYSRGVQVTVVADAPQPAELDGDAVGTLGAILFRADPSSLRVRAPRS